MPLTITSPKHSFVNFSGGITDFILPAYKSIAIAFQFMVSAASEIALSDTFQIKIADKVNAILYTPSFTATNICSWGRLKGIDDTDFPVTISGMPLAGTYATRNDLFKKINIVNSISIVNYDFLYCCDPATIPTVGFSYTNHASTVKSAAITFYKGLQQVTITEVSGTLFTALPLITECFKYVVVNGTDRFYSNLFKKEPNNNYLTRITYNNNEDGYGFRYPFDTVFNQVWIPMYLRQPAYPETRKVYRYSTGGYKVQSSVMEKEWELVTDYMPESIHEKLTVALGHDNIQFLNTRVSDYVTKKDDYKIEWEDNPQMLYAQAKCKILQPFEGRNSNCEKRISC